MSIPLAIFEAARSAAFRARSVSDGAAITAGVEVALVADRRYWARQLRTRLGNLPVTATSQRELLATLAEEFSAAADEIDYTLGRRSSHV